MRCPYCKNDINLQYLRGSKTLGLTHIFYDVDGLFHSHNMNAEESCFQCSCGKLFTEKTQNKCWCGWPDNEAVYYRDHQDLSYSPK